MTRIPRSAAATIAAVLALGLAGCTPPMTPGGDPETTPSAPVVETPAESPAPTSSEEPGGSGAPDATPEPEASPEPPGTTGSANPLPDSTASASPPTDDATRVRIGNDEFGVLDWNVSCSGLDSAPTITATASDDRGNDYVAMLLASASGELISFTFTWGPKGGGHSSKSGLSVTPATAQGTGTFFVADGTVASEGRGVSYGPFDKDLSVDTNYAVEFVCPRP